ncbi:MAG: carboxypeptidase regulatory-like domain-containing protein [Flavobacteriales bacterium]
MKRLLFTMLLALTVQFGWSQCTASFSFSSSTATVGDTITILNTCISSNNAAFYWDHSGSIWGSSSTTYDTTQTLSVLYSTPGTYWVCMYFYDSTWACGDSVCESIVITGSGSTVSASISASNATCGQCNGLAVASASGGVGGYTYSWSNGAFGQTTANLCAGTYTVTVNDANGNTATATTSITGSSGINVNLGSNQYGCSGDSILLDATNAIGTFTYLWNTGETTSSIVVTQSGTYVVTVQGSGCTGSDSVDVTISAPPSLTTSSTNETCSSCCNGTVSASAGSGPYYYTWSNGAGNVSSQSSLCPGTYTVTVEDTLTGCSTVATMTVSAYVSTCYAIEGTLTQGDEAMVYLIQESSGYLTAVDSTYTDSIGYYAFANVCNGTYYVKGALLVTNSQYGVFIPTYYTSAAMWANSTAVVVNSASVYNLNFSLISGVNQGGAGFVGGNISQGANRGEGDPVVGAVVMAYDEDGNVTGFDRTDASGNYQIDGLSYGKYSIYVDILNKTSYAHEVTLSVEHPNTSDRNFEVQGNVIKPITPNGIEVLNASSIRVYPNPTQSTLNVNSESVDAKSWAIYNILGERVMGESSLTNQAQINIDVQNLPDGNYILQVETENGMIQERIMKI